MGDIIVYIDRSEIREGKLAELKAGVTRLASVAQQLEPQLLSYSFFVDDEQSTMTVVVVHPDSASLEFHMETLAAEFRRLSPLLTLRSIEVFGHVSETAKTLLQAKARDLGNAEIAVHEQHAGFSRASSATH